MADMEVSVGLGRKTGNGLFDAGFEITPYPGPYEIFRL